MVFQVNIKLEVNLKEGLTVYSYSATASSVTVYLISLPSLYFANFVNSTVQVPSAAAWTSFESTFWPSAKRLIVILVGRFPSWLFASSQSIVKANASNFRLIRIEEIEFLEGSYFNLMVQIGLKNNGVWWNVKSDIFPIKLNSEV